MGSKPTALTCQPLWECISAWFAWHLLIPSCALPLLLQRSALTDDDIRNEVTALQQQGHRRILALTGEHPKYTFDQFLHVSRRRADVSSCSLGGQCCSCAIL